MAFTANRQAKFAWLWAEDGRVCFERDVERDVAAHDGVGEQQTGDDLLIEPSSTTTAS